LDEDGRLVNAAGYLIDEKGNIINKQGKIVFHFWEVLFNEPPKLFTFTEFSLDWIKGSLDRDVTQNPFHDDEYDLKGRRINTLGYLIDENDCIVDQHGKPVFKNDLLSKMYGMESQIPEVFRSGQLKKPAAVNSIANFSWTGANQISGNKSKNLNSDLTNNASFENTALPSDSRLAPSEKTPRLKLTKRSTTFSDSGRLSKNVS